jgi:FkbH-like protein
MRFKLREERPDLENSPAGPGACRTPDLDYSRLVRKSRRLDAAAATTTVRVAILSDAASQQFVPLLRVLFHENGVNAELYEGAFDALEIEALNPASGLYAFRPDAIVLATCTQALRERYYAHGFHSPDGDGFAEAAGQRLRQIWDAIAKVSAARIVQCNYVLPYERLFGNYDLKVPKTFYSAAGALNARIAELARERGNVLLCDVEGVASYIGRKHWYDDRLWNMAKAFCRLDYLPLVAEALVEIVLAAMGRVVKCVILDLDNTLWGGVVGDDGPLGISIGPHGDGEAFYHFQQYLYWLKQRGILLAVCSKNGMENALSPFAQNPGMVLNREDITVFVANWENKADNIRSIRETLGIGFDSMVFLDDNAFERNLVRELLPEVVVPELPEDPADYVRALNELNLFEASSFSAEDAARGEMYRQEAERRELKGASSNIDEFLKSLGMTMVARRFEPEKIPRIAQLIQRSNQFNLTTHRYSEGDCERMMLDQRWIPLYASLRDRLGDHGLISIVILGLEAEALAITDWLMSCRVLARGVEQHLMNKVVRIAREEGLAAITGEYIPTAKNGMVKEFFTQFGFEKVAEADGRSRWRLDVAAYQPRAVYITEGE